MRCPPKCLVAPFVFSDVIALGAASADSATLKKGTSDLPASDRISTSSLSVIDGSRNRRSNLGGIGLISMPRFERCSESQAAAIRLEARSGPGPR